MIEDPTVRARILAAARDPESPAFARIITYATDWVLGRPALAVTLQDKTASTGVLLVPLPPSADQWGSPVAHDVPELALLR